MPTQRFTSAAANTHAPGTPAPGTHAHNKGMGRLDVFLTVSTVMAATAMLGVFVRSTMTPSVAAAERPSQESAVLMQIASPAPALIAQPDPVHIQATSQTLLPAPHVIRGPEPAAPVAVEAQIEPEFDARPAAEVVSETVVHVADEPLSFDDRPLKLVKTITMTVTAYSPDERSCGKWADGITFSGKSVHTNGMQLVAADPRMLPIGSVISVPGYADARPVPVLDIGGAIKGNRLDVLFATHEQALAWGVRKLKVHVYAYAD